MHENLLKQTAISAAQKAGNKLKELLQSEIKFQKKSSHDILAEGDLLSEKIIMDEIKQIFPDHSFLSEEAGEVGKSENVWVIDPIDGTINFSRMLEDFCVSIAFIQKGEIKLGVIYQPLTEKLYLAQRDKGAFLNERILKVSQTTEVSSSILATDCSSKLASRQDNFDLLKKVSQDFMHVRIFGSGALHLAKIAEGKLDTYFKTRMNYWDYAAGILLVEEAGGKVSDFENKSLTTESPNIVVTNGVLHSKVLSLLSK